MITIPILVNDPAITLLVVIVGGVGGILIARRPSRSRFDLSMNMNSFSALDSNYRRGRCLIHVETEGRALASHGESWLNLPTTIEK